jgi:hypothetical protein
MDEFFASKPTTNDSFLCVGPLTRADAAEASDEGIGNGLGYYIYVAESSDVRSSVEILGKLASEAAARKISDILGLSGGSAALA